MFKPGKDTLSTDPIPERVYAIVEYIKRHAPNSEKAITKSELQGIMCMSDVFDQADNKDIFNASFNAATELGLITVSDGGCYGTEALGRINSISDFRYYAADIIFDRDDSIFTWITTTYINMAEEMQRVNKWENVVEILQKNAEEGETVAHNAVLGWRFWAQFLGIGYVHNGMLIPNMARRFADVLKHQTTYSVNRRIPISEFMIWLENECPEMQKSRDGKSLGLAVSNGLRTLDEIGIIKMERLPDAEQWILYKFQSQNEVSHIVLTVKGGR